MEPVTLPRPQSVLEAGGESSTVLLAAIERRLEELAPGQVLEVSAQALAAPIDAVVWCHVTGHRLVGLIVADPVTRIWIRKRAL
jgi:TusA-related sulfurtransferase